jgi:hypothetical protein
VRVVGWVGDDLPSDDAVLLVLGLDHALTALPRASVSWKSTVTLCGRR